MLTVTEKITWCYGTTDCDSNWLAICAMLDPIIKSPWVKIISRGAEVAEVRIFSQTMDATCYTADFLQLYSMDQNAVDVECLMPKYSITVLRLIFFLVTIDACL